MKLSVNSRIIDKNILNDKNAFRSGYKDVDFTPEQLAESINQGFAYSSQYGSKTRKTDHFKCSDIISADFDKDLKIEDALNDPFIIQYGTIFYKTPSHTDENHRFRVIFQLPHTITDANEYARAASGLSRKLNSDPAATDAARLFFGCKNSNPKILGNSLSKDELDFLIELGQSPRNLLDTVIKNSENVTRPATTRSVITLKSDLLVRSKNGELVPILSLPKSSPIYCPIHNDRNPSAHTVLSNNGVVGVHCSSCQSTFWVKNDSKKIEYDFFEFDDIATKLLEDESKETYSELDGFVDLNKTPLTQIIDEEYLTGIPFESGVTLIKSPKGSGKTKSLKRFISECRNKKLSILMIGHRRSLLRASSEKLGLKYYIKEKSNQGSNYTSPTNEYAICVDSIPNLLNPIVNKYKVVIIDESEQVFSHLISETLSLKRTRCYQMIRHYIRNAEYVVAMDADINRITLRAILDFDTAYTRQSFRCFLNTYKLDSKSLFIYKNKNHLITEMYSSIEKGERCFVCCNSKKQVDEFVMVISVDFPASKVIDITSDNIKKHEDFIQNIQEDILNYDVILSSPALGTGIDISFDDDVQHIDSVFGFFESRITTHHDIDQQLSRVRDPKLVKVWINPEQFNFETEFEPIKSELLEQSVLPETLDYIDDDGNKVYRELPFLNLYTEIIAAQRASKNDLLGNFIHLRERNGWKIIQVDRDEKFASLGSEIGKDAKKLRTDARNNLILNSSDLGDESYYILKDRKNRGEELNQSESTMLERSEIERFYLNPISPELIKLDNEGKFRKQILKLESLVNNPTNIQDIMGSESDGEIQPNFSKINKDIDLLTKVLITTKIFDGAKFDTNIVVNLQSLKRFIKFCNSYKPKINSLLNIDVRTDIQTNPVQQLNLFLYLIGLKVTPSSTKRLGKGKVYEYKLNVKKLNTILQIVETRKSHQNNQTVSTQNKIQKNYINAIYIDPVTPED